MGRVELHNKSVQIKDITININVIYLIKHTSMSSFDLSFSSWPPKNFVNKILYFGYELYVPALRKFNTLVSWTISHITKVTSASGTGNVQLDASVVTTIWFAHWFAIGCGIGDESLVSSGTSHWKSSKRISLLERSNGANVAFRFQINWVHDSFREAKI